MRWLLTSSCSRKYCRQPVLRQQPHQWQCGHQALLCESCRLCRLLRQYGPTAHHSLHLHHHLMLPLWTLVHPCLTVTMRFRCSVGLVVHVAVVRLPALGLHQPLQQLPMMALLLALCRLRKRRRHRGGGEQGHHRQTCHPRPPTRPCRHQPAVSRTSKGGVGLTGCPVVALPHACS
jgi:hypothetical protein